MPKQKRVVTSDSDSGPDDVSNYLISDLALNYTFFILKGPCKEN